MKPAVLSIFCCPRCGAELNLIQSHRGDDGDIESGALECAGGCGAYPIEAGVPVLLPERRQQTYSAKDLQDATRSQFSNQWNMFRYGDTTWGVTVEQRVPVVLHELGWTESDLPGKVILDAGCGNGTLTHALAERGATVIGLDLSSAVFRAHKHCRHENLHFVQGNLFFPPLRQGVFDAIYSCGVFHHTPDTRKCFDNLLPTLKSDGDARFFIWLYAPRSPLFNVTVEPLMRLTRHMPGSVLGPLCKGLSPVVELGSRTVTALGIQDYGPRTLRDRSLQLHDLLAPRYVWYHRFGEAKSWAEQAGFACIEQTDYQPANGAVRPEVKPLLDQYRSICRPGFGMLCRNRQPQPAHV